VVDLVADPTDRRDRQPDASGQPVQHHRQPLRPASRPGGDPRAGPATEASVSTEASPASRSSVSTEASLSSVSTWWRSEASVSTEASLSSVSTWWRSEASVSTEASLSSVSTWWRSEASPASRSSFSTGWRIENRGEIVRDALTILRAHALAGWPNGGWPLQGSFEEWDRVVRGAVWFATNRDCLATQVRAAEESPDRLNRINLLEAWRELPGGKLGEGGVTAAEALTFAEKEPEKYATLRNALLQNRRDGKLPTSGSLGMTLGGMKNSLIGGLKLKRVGDIKRAALWSVELVDAG
jgi:hypothetical protein